MAQLAKNPPAMWEIWVRSLGWEDPLEKGKATHFSILAWRIHRLIFMDYTVHEVTKSCTQLSDFHLLTQGDGEEPACNVGDLGSISGSGRYPGEGNGYPLQYSCLENPMDREAWWATVHGVTKSWT